MLVIMIVKDLSSFNMIKNINTLYIVYMGVWIGDWGVVDPQKIEEDLSHLDNNMTTMF